MSAIISQKPLLLKENVGPAKGPRQLLSNFRPSKIPAMVKQFHCRDEVPSMIPIMLQENEVTRFRLDFRDGQTWLLYVPAHLYYKEPEDIISIVKAEAAEIWSYNGRNDPSTPQLIMSSPTFKNDIGFPFLLVTFRYGRPSEAHNLPSSASENNFYGARDHFDNRDRRVLLDRDHSVSKDGSAARDDSMTRNESVTRDDLNNMNESLLLSRDDAVARDISERALRLARRHARQRQRIEKGKGIKR